ncbi:MAG: DNA helicase RecQ [Anaerolineaceae bacterium]|nr:DNA helicase RecQ [Anaerolineaceae bacterium]
MTPQEILKETFGYDNFRPGQEKLINAVLSGRDAMGIMPTGAGKSVCFQIPSLVFEGLTLVISPLISLMLDQVLSLKQYGIRAAFLNSTLTPGQQRTVLSRAAGNAYQIMYVAPERLSAPSFLSFCQNYAIPFVAVDEAHCISQWGHAFRRDYLQIKPFLSSLPRRPIVGAYTATATAKVREDIVSSLGLQNPVTQINSFDRPNLYFDVARGNKTLELRSFLRRHVDDSGIIYCGTRKDVEEICDSLNRAGFDATRYHAGLPDKERTDNQNDFLYDRKKVMVATNAFGMGIDKSNVSFVVHYSMPKNIESYYQEAGRAGRDGSPAECLLLYSAQDIRLNEFLIRHSLEENNELSEQEKKVREAHELDLLKKMTFYATANDCLRMRILDYFGEHIGPCGHCGNCSASYEEVEISARLRIILSSIRKMDENHRSFGRVTLRDFFKGSRSQAIISKGLDRYYGYGALSSVSAERILQIIDWAVQNRWLRSEAGEYPVIRLGQIDPAYWTSEDEKIFARLPYTRTEKEKQKTKTSSKDGLFERLRLLRKDIAEEQNVPAFMIFSDATLIDMVHIKPVTIRQLLAVKGVGKIKADQYGQRFIDCICDYLEENGG